MNRLGGPPDQATEPELPHSVSGVLALRSNGLQPKSDGLAMASNLRAMASNLRAMASNLRAMASNLLVLRGVLEISPHSFTASGLTTITLPETTESIGDSAFEACRSLSDLVLLISGDLGVR